MPEYKAPLKDIEFVMNEVLDFEQHYASLPGGEEATPDLVNAILVEAAKFSEEVILLPSFIMVLIPNLSLS